MKRKSKILLCVLLSFLLLTGCNNSAGDQLPEQSQEPTTDTIDMSQYLTVTDVVEYEVNTQVGLESVLTIDAAVVGNVSQTVMLDETGVPVNVLNTAQTGTYKVTIIVEFIDGSTGTVEYTYNVIDPIMPKEYLDNFLNVKEVFEGKGFSFAEKDMSVHKDYDFGIYDDRGNELSGIANIEADSSYQMLYTDKMSEQNVLELLKTSTVAELIGSDVGLIMRTEDLSEGYSVLIDDKDFDLSNEENSSKVDRFYEDMLSVYSQIVEDISIPSINVYDTNSKSNIVFRSYKILFDFSIYDSSLSWTQIDGVWVASHNNCIYVISKTIDLSGLFGSMSSVFEISLPDGVDPYKLTEDVFTYANYGNFVKVLYGDEFPYTVDKLNAQATDCIESNTHLSYTLQNKIIYGSWSQLMPKEETVVDTPTTEGTPGETSTPEVADVSKEGTHKNNHPELYTMFKDNETRFYRWMFDLANASYAGSVYKPDGTLLPKEDVEEGANYDSKTGQSSEGSSSYSREAYTLSTSYNSYTLDDVAKPEMIFNTANSSASRLVVEYNDLKYYVEATKSTKVSAYKTNCLYSTSSFKNSEFTVVEDQMYTLDDWKATKYSMTYTNTSGDKVTRPYMVVLTTDTDYIVCYANDLVDTEDTDILYNILTWCMNTEIESNMD